MNTRRLGRFCLPCVLLRQGEDALLQVFAQCIVLEATCHIATDSVEYLAMCERFYETDPGDKPPLYTWIFEEGQVPRPEAR